MIVIPIENQQQEDKSQADISIHNLKLAMDLADEIGMTKREIAELHLMTVMQSTIAVKEMVDAILPPPDRKYNECAGFKRGVNCDVCILAPICGSRLLPQKQAQQHTRDLASELGF